MSSFRPPTPKPLDLHLTIIYAKHLKNVNWKNGDLKPYAVFWIDPDCRLATKSDDAGSTKPVWNERFTLPLTLPLQDSFLTLEIFHSKPSETPKPLVGTLRFPLQELDDPEDSNRIRTFLLYRPSGRPQGKIRLKLAVLERPLPQPDYQYTPQQSYYYSSAPPPPRLSSTGRNYMGYNTPSSYVAPLQVPPLGPSSYPAPPYPYGYPDTYTGYYSGYYINKPPPPRGFFDRQMPYEVPSGPSAPVDYSPYDQKSRSAKMGKGTAMGTGLAMGAVAGALGGLALGEGLKYEEGKIAERVDNDLAARDDYSDYRADY